MDEGRVSPSRWAAFQPRAWSGAASERKGRETQLKSFSLCFCILFFLWVKIEAKSIKWKSQYAWVEKLNRKSDCVRITVLTGILIQLNGGVWAVSWV